jgi:DNA-binding response OmpR family regulator
MTMIETLLVIDDDADLRAGLVALLEPLGYRVLTAGDGRTAWELLEQHAPDLLLVDWELPDVDGLSLIRRMREMAAHRDRYVIMITGRSDKTDLIKGMDEGANDYLAKPFDEEEPLVRIRVGIRTRRLEKELAEQIRRTTVLEMAGSVAHEIGNPLAAAKLLQQKMLAGSSSRNLTERVNDLRELGNALQQIELLVRKAQTITNIQSKPYAGDLTIIDLKGTDPTG